jgi:hypothetical protein
MTRRSRPRTWSCSPQIALGRLGDERQRPPVTLPKLSLDQPDTDDTAVRFMEHRTIKRGLEAWQAINRVESFEGYAAIGRALAVGRDCALKATGANAPMGRRYSLAFSDWIKRHGFVGMQKSVRSVTLELHANIEAITAWRNGLPERQRKRLVHPLSVTRRWRASTTNGTGKCPADLKRDAMAAWRRFVSCIELLPPDQARPLWQAAEAQTTAALSYLVL